MLKALGSGSATGPLYAVDARLRPHGASGPLVMTLDAFRDYLDRSTQPWERMAFTRARVVFATGGFGRKVTEAIRTMLAAPTDPVQLAAQALAMRRRLEASRPRQHLKRGFGGVADIEFIVQYLQLVHAAQPAGPAPPQSLGRARRTAAPRHHRPARPTPSCATPTTSSARSRAGCGSSRIATSARCPRLPAELERLARRLNYDSADPARSVAAFLADVERFDPSHPGDLRPDHHRPGPELPTLRREPGVTR